MKTISTETDFIFSETFSRGDLTKWGASDFYDDKEAELCAALASGKPFDTEWGGCKKEICSSRVSFDGKTLTCKVSVSDDFDTEGLGTETRSFSRPYTIDDVTHLLDEAHKNALECQRDNADYTGFSIHAGDITDPWVETYIAQRSDMAGYMDCPPGDNYHQWGFQDETDEIPVDVRNDLENYIIRHQFDKDFAPYVSERWTVKRWDK